MLSSAWALQQAVFAVLSCNSTVQDEVADRIFDAVPRGSDFPYIVIGDGSETAASDLIEHSLSINIWSRGGGHREAKRIAAAVRDALDGMPLTLDGHSLIDIRFDTADYSRWSDGETWRGVVRFRAVTEQT